MQLVNRTLLEGLVVTGHEVCFLQTRGKDRSLLCEGRMAMKMGISPDLGFLTCQVFILQPEGNPVVRGNPERRLEEGILTHVLQLNRGEVLCLLRSC